MANNVEITADETHSANKRKIVFCTQGLVNTNEK